MAGLRVGLLDLLDHHTDFRGSVVPIPNTEPVNLTFVWTSAVSVAH